MSSAGLQPDVICLNAAMNAVREAAFLEGDEEGDTAQLRAQLAKWRRRETMHTYNSEIAVLAMQRSLLEGASTALRLLKEMADNGIPRDVDTFNMVLEVCSRADDLQATRRVLEELRNQTICQPDVFSYLTAGVLLLRHGLREEGVGLLQAMLGLAPSERGGDVRYYTSLWPQTYKQLHKALLALAEEAGSGGNGCDIIVQVMTFLRERHTPPFDAESLAEQLASRRLCSGYLAGTRLTGGALDSDPLVEPQTL